MIQQAAEYSGRRGITLALGSHYVEDLRQSVRFVRAKLAQHFPPS